MCLLAFKWGPLGLISVLWGGLVGLGRTRVVGIGGVRGWYVLLKHHVLNHCLGGWLSPSTKFLDILIAG